MAFELTATQQMTLRLKPVDSRKNPAQVDGIPTWATDNTDVLALEPATDGLSCKIKAVGPMTAPGTTVMVTARGDADLGAGVREIVSTAEYTVKAGEAQSFEFEAGPIEEQPATPPTP